MIEKVRSIAITLFFEEETAGEPIAAAYSERAVARQGVTKACVNQARPWGKGQNGNAGELPFQRGGKAAASRKLIRGSCCFPPILRRFFYRGVIEPDGSFARLTVRM
jgi:hypothetical protein